MGSAKGCRGRGAVSNSVEISGTCPIYLQKVENVVQM